MFAANIDQHRRYDFQNDDFQSAYAFLRRPDLADLPVGPISLGRGITAHIQQYTTSPADRLRFEAHERYFDIQYLVSGQECIGLVRRSLLTAETEYDPDSDIQFYHEPAASSRMILNPGDYVIIGPEMAHKPCCAVESPQVVRKIVVKIPVNMI